MAFRVDVEHVETAPSWLVNEHFAVAAKATAIVIDHVERPLPD